jgi:hypothetical protein
VIGKWDVFKRVQSNCCIVLLQVEKQGLLICQVEIELQLVVTLSLLWNIEDTIGSLGVARGVENTQEIMAFQSG